ncbi:MAG: hypothetical protein CHACPFDD_01814 [Phycisphaerae bacterium]|nr:hypothetical protein [Phycisphaerae bacterium]
MRSDTDHFATLGLTPGVYDPREIAERFLEMRLRLSESPFDDDDSRTRLAAISKAYEVLRDPAKQAAHRELRRFDAPADSLRRVIDASLEDGLLRYSRRQEILAAGRALGFSDFQTQLMIAQVQFGDERIDFTPCGAVSRSAAPHAWPGASADPRQPVRVRPPQSAEASGTQCSGGGDPAPRRAFASRVLAGLAATLLAASVFVMLLRWIER